MSKSEKGNNGDGVASGNILRITDELVRQVNLTRKLVLVMIAVTIVAIPVSWHVSPLLTRDPHNFVLAGYATIAIAAAFVAVGVRQWLALSKWTARYKAYKQLQEKVDRQLDFEGQQANR